MRMRFYCLLLVFLFSMVVAPEVFAMSATPSDTPMEEIAEKKPVNEWPVVLVHGFSGWNREELMGYPYWGGFSGDIQENINKTGTKCVTAWTGPVSSNWDRACELYACIKGGRVDYGKAHSKKCGHDRFGRDYEGLIKEWGDYNPETQKKIKVHLLAHSMGGQTSRLLAQLLENGFEAEKKVAYEEGDAISPLFAGSDGTKGIIASVTTVSTPHDGTTLTSFVTNLIPHVQQITAFIASNAGLGDEFLYDFKLDQWGLKRLPDEPYRDYAERVRSSSLWDTTNDISVWDLSPEGAKELNKWVKAQPDIYYFSWSTEATYLSKVSGKERPEPIFMYPLFVPTGYFMGSYTSTEEGKVPINSDWWANDGVVNLISQNGPKIASDDVITQYTGTPEKGKWNHMGILNSVDHFDIIGNDLVHNSESFSNVNDWYMEWANFLKTLE